ncbi:patatin-like phospholipase family protein [Alicyclobacillus sp. SO9]|uniref:patatin-like phospholipase family protein n=1 Tax=Alicyclobacillus sp. SO9 TaxID=2665646 RepID=UPI0018E84667|nr:patatin-like phospholipase family protein [Alicyclobacillus sp. SO9]QQE80756.1 patatin-like phospholipase family protein [Alicyclobacillus sp. SO9]
MTQRRVGVALGSGGAKGFAHVGVLKALQEYHVNIDVVAGASMGSLIGAFYATGMTVDFMERLAYTLRWRHWVDLTVPKVGLIAGDKLHAMVKLLTRSLTIEESPMPYAAVATELVGKQLTVFRTGLMADAVRASTAIPGVFVPFAKGDNIYVDGGVMEPVPVQAARDLGAEVVIGVDVSAPARGIPPSNMMEVILHSLEIMQEQVRVSDEATVMIVPDLQNVGSSQFHRAKEAVAAGYTAAVNAMDDILAAVSEHQSSDAAGV